MNATTETTGARAPVDELLGTVGEAMTRDVVKVLADMHLGSAARVLEAAGVSGAPVVDQDQIVGVISLKDLYAGVPPAGEHVATTGPFHRWEHVLDEISMRKGITVRDVMAHRVVTVTEDTPLREAAQLMIRYGVNRLPVIDDRGRPDGIISRENVVAAVAKLRATKGSRAASPALPPD